MKKWFKNKLKRKYIELFICELIDNHEGTELSEEFLSDVYGKFIKKYNLWIKS